LQRHASHGDLTWVARPVVEEDLAGAWLVVAATNDPALNDEIAGWAHARQIFCIDASDAARGSARQAAMSTHGEVTIGVVSTDAPDPHRIRGIRDAVAAHIDAGHVDLRRRRAGIGRVILVGSGPGDPGLVTVRGRQALSEADVVVADRLGAAELLVALPADVEVINVERAGEGKTVVRLKGGDPFVLGRGGEEVHACITAGIPVEVVPGVTSALSVPALAGIPVTQRGISHGVLVTSGHAGPDAAAVAAMANGTTVVVLMGRATLPRFAEAGIEAGAHPLTPVAMIERGSTPHERITRATLESAARIADETDVKPPVVIVIGEVARDGLLASDASAT
jgi:uroporphyrin-III C-methyltransferase/precorrin-2 dehydrogenase/sirohydrochlorin ferrochelatase